MGDGFFLHIANWIILKIFFQIFSTFAIYRMNEPLGTMHITDFYEGRSKGVITGIRIEQASPSFKGIFCFQISPHISQHRTFPEPPIGPGGIYLDK